MASSAGSFGYLQITNPLTYGGFWPLFYSALLRQSKTVPREVAEGAVLGAMINGAH